MAVSLESHPPKDRLEAFGLGQLAPPEAGAIEDHLAACDSCCTILNDLLSDPFLVALRAAAQLIESRSTQPTTAPSTTAQEVPEIPAELNGQAKYRVVQLVGRGGMGAVYRAYHHLMDRPVALKVINPRLLQHPEARARFQQEVKAAARLNHPHIVTAHDAEQAGALTFLVMEYVEGQTLAEKLKAQGPLPISQACEYVRQAALGLQHAHEKGMVHRDIKPHNLMLTPTGTVKVLDFGLARFVCEEPLQGSPNPAWLAGPTAGRSGEPSRTEASHAGSPSPARLTGPTEMPSPARLTGPTEGPDDALTHTGMCMGTLDYMAPEQAADPRQADGRADIYSLGCTLYHLLSGQVPFPGTTVEEKLMRLRKDEPADLTRLRPEVPPELASVMARLLARDPAARYQTPAEVATALTPFTVPAGRRTRRPLALMLALAAVVLLTTVATATVVRFSVEGDREVVIQTTDPAIQVIARGERIVRIIDPKTGKAYQLDREQLTLGLADDPNGLQVTLNGQQPIVLRRNGGVIATVRLARKGAAEEGEQSEPPSPRPARRIFNGQDLTGWVVDCGNPKAWRVENGELVATGMDYLTSGFLLTEKVYADFRLQLEFQLSAGANSGVVVRAVPGEGRANWNAPPQYLEVQLRDDSRHPDKDATGSLYWAKANGSYLRPEQPAPLRPMGRWNALVVEARGGLLRAWVNGQRVLNADLDKLAGQADARSGVNRRAGRVGLQQHTGEVRFRHIEIQELRPEAQVSQKKHPPLNTEVAEFLDPANWRGSGRFWSVKDGIITGATGLERLPAHTYLCSSKKYRDFELRFQVRVTGKGWAGNSGVQIRSTLVNPEKWIVRGPQCDIGDGYWGCLYGELCGGLLKEAPWQVTAQAVKEGVFNDYFIRCVGKRVTIRVNGRTTVDDEIAELSEEGIIAWQLHEGGGMPMTVTFRSIELKELSSEPQFFNGKDLSGWTGLPGYWKVRNGSIVGAPANGVPAHTFLCSQQTYRDFELRFQVRRKNGVGNSGVQFRSRLTDVSRCTVTGPQIEIDSAGWRLSPGSIVTEPTGSPSVKSNAEAVARVWKETEFNDVTIRCVGEHVKVVINGVVAVDADFPSMPAEGIIAWQLHGGFGEIAAPEEVTFRNIQFTDLSQRRADGFVPLFNGVDLTGWKTHPRSPGDWRVEDGELVGRGPRKNCLYSERGDYEDFHFRVEAMINQGGNSGQLFRKAFSAGLSGDGYEAQIDNSFHAGRTGSLFVIGGSPTVRVAETLVPVDTWFTQEVIAQGNHIRILVNGETVVDHVDRNRTWQRGHLALQLYEPETVVRFRRLEVKELRPATAQVPEPAPSALPARQPPALAARQMRACHLLLRVEGGNDAVVKNRLIAWKKQLLAEVETEVALLPASTDTATRQRERQKLIERKFIDLARKESVCPSRSQGGDLGWIQRQGAVVEPFARAAFALQPFEISDPVATDFGYHLILAIEYRPAHSLNFPPGFSQSRYPVNIQLAPSPLPGSLPNLFPPRKAPGPFC